VSQHQHVSRGERRPSPPPREADDRLVTGIGTAAWAVALVVVLIARDALPAGSQWWVWTCVTGLAMGLFALWYVPVLKRGRQRAAERRSQPSGAVSRDSGSKTVSSTETPGSSTKS
jgi:Protein of unknown function (DUF2530)